jgi:hypothetical protein
VTTETIEARLTPRQLLAIGIHAGQVLSCFLKSYFHQVIALLAGDCVRSE